MTHLYPDLKNDLDKSPLNLLRRSVITSYTKLGAIIDNYIFGLIYLNVNWSPGELTSALDQLGLVSARLCGAVEKSSNKMEA